MLLVTKRQPDIRVSRKENADPLQDFTVNLYQKAEMDRQIRREIGKRNGKILQTILNDKLTPIQREQNLASTKCNSECDQDEISYNSIDKTNFTEGKRKEQIKLPGGTSENIAKIKGGSINPDKMRNLMLLDNEVQALSCFQTPTKNRKIVDGLTTTVAESGSPNVFQLPLDEGSVHWGSVANISGVQTPYLVQDIFETPNNNRISGTDFIDGKRMDQIKLSGGTSEDIEKIKEGRISGGKMRNSVLLEKEFQVLPRLQTPIKDTVIARKNIVEGKTTVSNKITQEGCEADGMHCYPDISLPEENVGVASPKVSVIVSPSLNSCRKKEPSIVSVAPSKSSCSNLSALFDQALDVNISSKGK